MSVLTGKVAVITGGTRGLGLGMARAYAREGAKVVVASRDQSSVAKAIETLAGEGLPITGLACDVAEAARVSALAEHALHEHGHLDIWVNNAGLSGAYGPTALVPRQDFENVVRANILGVFNGSMTALQHFLPRGQGKLVNVMGMGSRSLAPMQNAYGSSKAWNRAFTLTLAREYKDSGVGIFAFSPGMVLTDLLLMPRVLDGFEGRLGRGYQTVLRVLARPPEVAAAKAVWIASPATDGKTGLEVRAGGMASILGRLLQELARRLAGRPAPEFALEYVRVPPADGWRGDGDGSER
jgi:NAD(P)-dependent dehydrogenase (short-subunit alcohol dehydrogenase family)